MRYDDENNDAKLTAYALGELAGDEARDVEARLTSDEGARREVEAIRALAGELTDELAKEPMPEIVPAPRPIVRRWPARLALAAAASIVIGGVTVALMMPIFEPARYSRRHPVTRPAGVYTSQQPEASSSLPPAYALTTRGDEKKDPYDDILRYPTPAATEHGKAVADDRKELAEAQKKVGEMSATISDLTSRLDVTERERRNLSENLGYISNPATVSPAPARGTEAKRMKVEDGQNVLYGDGNVEFQQNPFSGVQRDHVYTATDPAKQPFGRPAKAKDANDSILLPTDEFAQDGAGSPTLQGVIRERRNIAGTEYATISLGSADKVMRGARFDVVSDGAVLGKLTVEMVEAEEATGRLEGPRIVEVKPGTNVQCAVDGREFNTEAYDRVVDNSFLDVVANPLSTFSIDVDTASYSNVRRFLTGGQLPPKDAVRIEEMVNYFPYEYAAPAKDHEHPFNADVEVTQCPWKPENRLVRVALKGMEIAKEQRPPSNLVFLIDVSGSMKPANKLPLLKESMKLLVHELKPSDCVSMVVYAGSSGLVLQSTSASQKDLILAAIDRLDAGGSTNGAQGIELAYSTAMSNLIQDGVNRVILCTDGDFNVGVTNQGDLTRLIEEKAKTGVFLSVLGFGMGNVKDSTMEKLADKGNGNYAYIDTLSEGKKVLVDQMTSTLVTIAKDVKIQIEFNPAVAGAYRLIGYENRMLAKEDFNDDKKDAGEIGAGHTVTALYEIVPAGQPIALPGTDPLKYQAPAKKPDASKELMTLKLRYKAPDGDVSKLMEVPVTDAGKPFAQASGDLKFASGVAAFGMLLRESPHKGSATFGGVLEWAQEGVGHDEAGYRKEFIELVKKANALKPQ